VLFRSIIVLKESGPKWTYTNYNTFQHYTHYLPAHPIKWTTNIYRILPNNRTFSNKRRPVKSAHNSDILEVELGPLLTELLSKVGQKCSFNHNSGNYGPNLTYNINAQLFEPSSIKPSEVVCKRSCSVIRSNTVYFVIRQFSFQKHARSLFKILFWLKTYRVALQKLQV
jgi:hypothetical protein